MSKFNTVQGRMGRAAIGLAGLHAGSPGYSFVGSSDGDLRLIDKSWMNREVHVRFREDVGEEMVEGGFGFHGSHDGNVVQWINNLNNEICPKKMSNESHKCCVRRLKSG